MAIKNDDRNLPKSCALPRKQEAIEALLGLAWRKEKSKRPNWLIQEIKPYC